MAIKSEQNDDLRISLDKIAKLCKQVRNDLSHTSGASEEEREIETGLVFIFEEVLRLELASRSYLGREDRPRLAKILQ